MSSIFLKCFSPFSQRLYLFPFFEPQIWGYYQPSQAHSEPQPPPPSASNALSLLIPRRRGGAIASEASSAAKKKEENVEEAWTTIWMKLSSTLIRTLCRSVVVISSDETLSRVSHSLHLFDVSALSFFVMSIVSFHVSFAKVEDPNQGFFGSE